MANKCELVENKTSTKTITKSLKVSPRDARESFILKQYPDILPILLKDRTVEELKSEGLLNDCLGNIKWCTDNYQALGFNPDEEMRVQDVTGINEGVIRPRIDKSVEEQRIRSKDKAEVFTPAWVCNAQNNLVDEAWFGRPNVFNYEREKNWRFRNEKVTFPDGKTWQDYVLANRLEVSCGEAPYLVNRYDTVSGKLIPVRRRIGILDRKLRIVCENVEDESTWYKWAIKAFQSTYGFEWQGDNILLARENLFFTFYDFYQAQFKQEPPKRYLKKIADIISWNIWQMDGIKFVIPNSCKDEIHKETTLFGIIETPRPCEGCRTNNHSKHTGVYARIYDWTQKKSIEFYKDVVMKGINP